mgnify:CR=1 FL=1
MGKKKESYETMSEDDDNPFDQDELSEAFGNQNPDELTPEEIFSLVMINKKRMVKTRIELRDEFNEIVPLHEVITSLLENLREKLDSSEENQIGDQIFPMMAQAMVSGLGRMVGTSITGFFLASDVIRLSVIQMMCISFLLLKYVQVKKLTIVAIEEPIVEEEIHSIERKARANSVATFGAMSGMSYKDILKELVDKGELTKEDLESMLVKDKDDDDPTKLS